MVAQRPSSQHRDVSTGSFDSIELPHLFVSEDFVEAPPWEDDDRLHEIFLTLHQSDADLPADEEPEIEPVQIIESAPREIDLPTSFDFISSDDSVGLYLKEMSRVPLLSVDEELQLARRIEQASIARRDLDHMNGRCSARRRHNLEMIIEDGRQAREHLIKANTRLVVSIAKRYIGRGVPFLDLIQEGNLGLMKAVSKYEYQRGFRFSTYATWWIRQTITRSIADQARTIRIPVHMTDRIRLLYKAAHRMEQRLGYPPSVEELSQELEVEADKIQWMLQVSRMPISLESPVGDDEDSEFGMFVEDEITPSPSQAAYEIMLRERVEQVLSTLSPREARIIRLRFGLENGHPYTLEEVGRKFGLTRERIRQIEGKALRRLRHPCRSRLLREYL
jgi:RNA polymerase primary sigma factor